MVINKHGDHLYNNLSETLRKHLVGIAEKVVAMQGVTFLKELKDRWDNHNKSMQMIRDILMVPPPLPPFPPPLHPKSGPSFSSPLHDLHRSKGAWHLTDDQEGHCSEGKWLGVEVGSVLHTPGK